MSLDRLFNHMWTEMESIFASTVSQTHKDGTVEHFYNGRLHREDGPAVIKKDGTKEYWLNGRQVTESDVQKLMDAKPHPYTLLLTKAEKEKVEKALGRKI